MARVYTKVRIFVASPSDVNDERERLGRVVESASRTGLLAEHLGLTLELLRWETHVAPDTGPPQGVVLKQLDPKDWDIFFGILWTRFGTMTGRVDPGTGMNYQSGTEEEFKEALRRRRAEDTGWPKIMFYRCVRSVDPLRLDRKQYGRVQKFFKQFESGGEHPGLVTNFRETDEFEQLAREHLEKRLLEFAEKNKAPPPVTVPSKVLTLKLPEVPAELVSGLVFLLLLDQNREGAWGRSLVKSSGSWGHAEDPGSITVSYWALQSLKAVTGEDSFPELEMFRDFLVRRQKSNGAVGVRRNVGSSWMSAYEIVENRRHTAIAAKFFKAFGTLDKALECLRYVLNHCSPAGAWSAVGDVTDENADPLTTAYVLRSLIDFDAEGLLREIAFKDRDRFLMTYKRKGALWLYGSLLEDKCWWLYRTKDEPISSEKLKQACVVSAEILAMFPEFRIEGEDFDCAYVGVLNRLAECWRQNGIGVPSGPDNPQAHLGATVQFVNSCREPKARHADLCSEFLPEFLRRLSDILTVGTSDAAGWAATLALLAEEVPGVKLSRTFKVVELRARVHRILDSPNAERASIADEILASEPAWVKSLALEVILPAKAEAE